MKAFEKLRTQYRPKGSGAGRRVFTLSRQDLRNLREIAGAFQLEERREPSGSMLVGAGLQLLRTYTAQNGAPVAWLEVGRKRA